MDAQNSAKGESLFRRLALFAFNLVPKRFRGMAWGKLFLLDPLTLDIEAARYHADTQLRRIIELEEQVKELNSKIKILEYDHNVEKTMLTFEVKCVTQMLNRMQERVRADTAEHIRRGAASLDIG